MEKYEEKFREDEMKRRNEEREERTREAEECERIKRQREFMWGGFYKF